MDWLPKILRKMQRFVATSVLFYLEPAMDVDFDEKFHLTDLVSSALNSRIGCPPPIANAGKDLSVDEPEGQS